jgi:hypothetical protein
VHLLPSLSSAHVDQPASMGLPLVDCCLTLLRASHGASAVRIQPSSVADEIIHSQCSTPSYAQQIKHAAACGQKQHGRKHIRMTYNRTIVPVRHVDWCEAVIGNSDTGTAPCTLLRRFMLLTNLEVPSSIRSTFELRWRLVSI